jgi:hypothetical protein
MKNGGGPTGERSRQTLTHLTHILYGPLVVHRVTHDVKRRGQCSCKRTRAEKIFSWSLGARIGAPAPVNMKNEQSDSVEVQLPPPRKEPDTQHVELLGVSITGLPVTIQFAILCGGVFLWTVLAAFLAESTFVAAGENKVGTACPVLAPNEFVSIITQCDSRPTSFFIVSSCLSTQINLVLMGSVCVMQDG